MKKKTTKPGKPGTSSPMDLTLIEQITRLMRDNDLSTVELREGDKRVIVKRGAQMVSMPTMMHQAPSASHAPAGTSHSAPPSTSAADDAESGTIAIKSPMVGTFYSSSSPDAKPFVNLGSTVNEDSDVCIIEAMKVFNNIKAECSGKIVKIMVNNGQTVEFGQVLFLVKPS